ncbi:MAG: hypothetical protein COB61_010975 [Thiotrichales bacterium]|nr:hypothetical protein [Thiotrichales bacterium]
MIDNNKDEHSLVDQVPQDFVNPVEIVMPTAALVGGELLVADDVPLGVESDIQHVDLEPKR